jgi:hypothetical protein
LYGTVGGFVCGSHNYMRIYGTPKCTDQDCDADPEQRIYHEFIVICVDKRYIYFVNYFCLFSVKYTIFQVLQWPLQHAKIPVPKKSIPRNRK